MASPVTYVFFGDDESVALYRAQYPVLRKNWPSMRDAKILLVCNAVQNSDSSYWREKFFFLDASPKVAMWDWTTSCSAEPSIQDKLCLSSLAVCGFTCPTPYYCPIHPQLQTTRCADFPPTEAIDPHDPPMFICNRTDLYVGDADFRRLEEWGDETVGFSEHPPVRRDFVKAWDVAIIFTRFARLLSIVTKNQTPIARDDFFMCYAALKRGERIVRLDSADMGTLG
jgi:hypothetical protein